MKKLILAAMAVMVGSLAINAQKLTTKADSMGYYIGASQGAAVARDFHKNNAGNPAKGDKYNKEFVKGIRDGMMADTVNTGYRDGVNMARQMLDEMRRMQSLGFPVNRQLFTDTFIKYFNGKELSNEEMGELFTHVRTLLEPMQLKIQQQQEAARQAQEDAIKAMADSNLAAGKAFIADIVANDPTVVVTPSGLAYKVIEQGEGPTATDDDLVSLYYTGRRIDGSVFDQTDGEVARFSPRGVIKGFAEGLKMMNKGSKYTLYIPANLAYGFDAPPVIGPNQTLVFDVEVVDITKPEN